METAILPMYSSALQNIGTLLKANIPYIWVNTYEERRFIKTLHADITEKQGKELWTWSCHQGLLKYDPDDKVLKASGDMEKTPNPIIALGKIAEYNKPKDCKGTVWVMKDFHTALQQTVPRQMRDLYHFLVQNRKTIIITSPGLTHGAAGRSAGMEPTLEKQISVVPYDLPTRAAIEDYLKLSIAHIKTKHKNKKVKTKLDYTKDEIEKFASALCGLTELEITNAVATSICHMQRIDEKKLLQEKKQIVARSAILEYIDSTPKIEDVGGLDSAKQYFDTYSTQFSKEAREFGVKPLRGVLLTGVPGTGKSLLAKAIAALWSLPLLRLDVGKVMTGLVGGSEEKMRQVISQVEAIAPCILWIDEIEKSLSGSKSSNFSDGGTLARVFGTLLTAMEEGLEGVVTIATANDIAALPPELIRRFNEVMFVDLPVPEEREEIFGIHLRKCGRDIKKLDLNMDELVAKTHLYTGSEIEKSVHEAIARAFRNHHGKKDLGQKELVGAIEDTKCIAKVMADKIGAIREWARDKARYASSLAEAAASPGNQKVTTSSGKELDLKSDLDDLDEVVPTGKEQKAKEKAAGGGDFAQFDAVMDDD